MATKQITVSESALLRRINRKLAHDDRKVRKARGFYDGNIGPYFNTDTGEFYMINVSRNFIICGGLDLETEARELGVMAKDESLAQ